MYFEQLSSHNAQALSFGKSLKPTVVNIACRASVSSGEEGEDVTAEVLAGVVAEGLAKIILHKTQDRDQQAYLSGQTCLEDSMAVKVRPKYVCFIPRSSGVVGRKRSWFALHPQIQSNYNPHSS